MLRKYDLMWIKILNSPFKLPSLKLYVGKIAVGVPYFLPRRWVKDKEKPGYLRAVPLKFGFSYCSLGWKTKWSSSDFRYEHCPVLSFVFFGYQIALVVGFRDRDSVSAYWEAWLYYELETDKTKSKRERIEQCKNEFPQTWIRYNGDKKEKIDYYQRILKSKSL